jgi:hypothetical protein
MKKSSNVVYFKETGSQVRLDRPGFIQDQSAITQNCILSLILNLPSKCL